MLTPFWEPARWQGLCIRFAQLCTPSKTTGIYPFLVLSTLGITMMVGLMELLWQRVAPVDGKGYVATFGFISTSGISNIAVVV